MKESKEVDERKKKKKILSEVGFEPTPTYVDQKSQTHSVSKV